MNVFGIVPARAGSKGLPGKNMRTLGDRPLVAWALEAALEAESLSEVFVSSDDPEVLALAGSRQGLTVVERPGHLAEDDSPAIDYVRHVLAVCGARDQGVDAVCIIQPTSPFTRGSDIDACTQMLRASDADTIVTVVEVPHDMHPIKTKTMVDGRLSSFVEHENGRMSRGSLPTVYVRNCSVYLTRRSVIESGAIIGADCRGVVMPRERSVDINDAYDFRLAEFLLASRSAPESK